MRTPRANARTRAVTREPALAPIEASRGLHARVVEVHPRDVVYLKSLVEASEGLASIFAEKGGVLTIASPTERVNALDELLRDLGDEIHIGQVSRG